MAERRKVTINLSDDAYNLLQHLASKNQTTMSEELRKAIADRAFFTERLDGESDLVLEQRDKSGTVKRTIVDYR